MALPKAAERVLSGAHYRFVILLEDGERLFCRGWRVGADGQRRPVLAIVPGSEQPSPASLRRLAHELELADALDCTAAIRPIELIHQGGRPVLVLEDPGGEPLELLLGPPMELGSFLRLAIGVVTAVRKLHQCGLVHKDLKPSHVLVNCPDRHSRLTGFGICSRLPRERQPLAPPETIAGTLAYMAPEQTGWMNRSIDCRTDLYSLGVTFYQMLAGELPFTATDPLEWVHCHIARQPLPLSSRREDVPTPVSRVVMKLLAKGAEDRYQSAGGLESDLRHCLAAWEAHGRIDEFPLGEHDTPDRLFVPEKLYGRAQELETLLASFDRVVRGGAPELVLVSGYSGIGKSSVVNELQKALVPRRGLFASGKSDQSKRDIPYSTLVQAFASLVRPLLGRSDAELAPWRDALVSALGPNARLLVDLIPDLKLIIGEPTPLPELEPHQTQRRFQLVLRRFISVFARPEHPLVLFLDDLQWLDAATLDVIEELLRSDLQHLMLIGAYRDNEIHDTHPLLHTVQDLRNAGAKVHEITLTPLGLEHIEKLLADALRCGSERAAPFARLVQEKTAGNPFFVIQFLYSLAEEGLLRFDHEAARWSWDLDHIRAHKHTDNVVDLMLGKLTRLPAETQHALQQLACVGNTAASPMLATVLQVSEQEVHAALWPAVRQELLDRLDGSYRFMHDRVQEAAYSQIPESMRARIHLRIGRLLLGQVPLEERDDRIFDIVNQLNHGVNLVADQQERDRVAELNLLAAQRAKISIAYASALKYLIAGAAMLREDAWERRHALTFQLEFHRAECEFLTGAYTDAEQRLAMLAIRAASTVERASVACLRLDLYTARGQYGRAVSVALEYLRTCGVEWPAHPTDEDVRGEYERFRSQLGTRAIENLVELPLMTDPSSLATMEVLIKMAIPTAILEGNLYALAMARAVNLSLEQGNSDVSCATYTQFGVMLSTHFGDYKTAYRLGQLGCTLIERRELKRFEARTYMSAGAHLLPLGKHIRSARALTRRAFDAASANGDLSYIAIYRCHFLPETLLAAGEPLDEVQREVEAGLAFAQNMKVGQLDFLLAFVGLLRVLRGSTAKSGTLHDEQFDEVEIEAHLASDPARAAAESFYYARKVQALFYAGDFAAAVQAASRVEHSHPIAVKGMFSVAEYCFYHALSLAAHCDSMTAIERQSYLDELRARYRQLCTWAEGCPENFENRAALVGAEIARLECRDPDAMHLYERAIRSARQNGFVHNEAVAYEVAARFYAGRDLEDISYLYLTKARHCYLHWGATGKVRQLDEKYPRLREAVRGSAPTSTFATPIEHLDLATVIKVSEAVSGEIVLEKMLDTLMRTAIGQAGAERGVLILSRAARLRIAASATTEVDKVALELGDTPVTASVLPESVLHHVLRTRESVILDDAAVDSPFSADPYIREHQVRSILCLPLINQGRLTGALYLENNLAAQVFAPARIAVLKLVASQAAISLENAYLYSDLRERESRIRRLIDANIIGVFVWDFAGSILEANDEFLRMIGYDREDLVSGRLRWTGMTPPDWQDQDKRLVREQLITGAVQPFEKEYFRKDGGRVPVLIGSATFEEGGKQGFAFVLDLTERKRVEIALLDARVAERTRIARDLHDTLLQSFNGVLLHLAVAARRFGAQPDEALKVLNEAIDQARRAVREGREAVEGLRSSTEESNDLAPAISRLAEELSGSTPSPEPSAGSGPQPIDVRVQVVGKSRRLHPIIRDEMYRIAAEALRNAYQHSHGTRIEVELRYDLRQFRLEVRDDGRGIEQELLVSGSREGHFGLKGMRERAELAGGKLTVWSAPGSGTEVEVTIPASKAYAAARTPGRADATEGSAKP